MSFSLPVAHACGQLLVGGFDGAELPASFARALRDGSVGGATLFRRNVESDDDGDDVAKVGRLCAQIARAAPDELPPLVAVDQEGGRVARLRAPALSVPPMRVLGARGDAALVERVARAQARELLTLGFTMSFAPVLDVDTNPQNPVIGDRAFSSDAHEVARLGLAYARGLAAGGLLACGKHFPGHGDTSVDSHLALPAIPHGRARLDEIELLPFRAAAEANVDALMTAHVVCTALDRERPATLSRRVCHDLLRGEIGFRGVVVSDDLEMKAISARYPIEEAAVLAVTAGCDVLLVCSDQVLLARAHAALVSEAEKSRAFRKRCLESAERVVAMRRRVPPRPADEAEIALSVGGESSRRVERAIAEALA
jgi:beta-N-acetylhexosaminidase